MTSLDISQDQVEVTRRVTPFESYLRILRWFVWLFAVGLLALFSFAYLFTTFVPWDDEGYFFQSYRDFLSGRALYDQVCAIHGPFTFWSAALLARFHAVNITHDNARWIMLPVWIAIAGLLAGIVWRWTARFAPSLMAFLLSGFLLKGLAKGVGHPQLWIILSVAVLLWLGLDWLQRGRAFRGFWIGFVVGVIFLSKINIGIFVAIAIALACGLHLRRRSRALACAALSTAAAAMGVLMLYASTASSEKYFVLVYLMSLAATIGCAMTRPMQSQVPLTRLTWLVAGVGICLFAGFSLTLLLGTTPGALVQSLIIAPSHFARNYHYAFLDATRKGSILLSVIGFAVYVVVLRWRRVRDTQQWRLGLMKLVVGVGLLFAFSYDHRLALTGSLLFLWLVIIDFPDLSDTAYSNRLLLALLAPLFSLQLFPTAGEQVDWACLLPVTAAALLLADGLDSVDRERSKMPAPRLTPLAVQATSSLLVVGLFLMVGISAFQRYGEWRAAKPLNLPGTHWLRLPPAQVSRLTDTVKAVSRNCQNLLTVPGLYSFSIWSGVPPMEEKRITTWPFLWPTEVEKNELSILQHQDQGCVLVSSEVYRFYKQFTRFPDNDALLSEVQRTMRPIFAIQDVVLYSGSRRPGSPSNSYDDSALKGSSATK